jgi:hypothetical protein
MTTENGSYSPSHTISANDSHPLSLPLFLSTSSSSLKPLRERNRTNLKRRINLSRSQVLSNDFENDDHLSTTSILNKNATTTINIANNTQPVIATRMHMIQFFVLICVE